MSIILASGDQLKIHETPIGVGGEGKVYRIANSGRENLVAKIYRTLPDVERQRKLEKMVSMQEPALLEVCAWPTELLVDTLTGAICGFTMQEIRDSEPFHHYYSPSWRKSNQPSSSWGSLLQLSANLAAAFNAVHRNGIIIGDVNPNSVRVRKNGRVVLIDSDSFQIAYQGEVFRCRVGVPSFTAPELLANIRSFDSVNRDFNHDLFGLSLLIFHTLFMGRHPFAGVFAGAGDTLIEEHIKEYRYAYAIDHVQRGLTPPPLSISPSGVAGANVVSLFQNDFTQMGAIQGRTSADQWFEALCAQLKKLQKCSLNHNHRYDSSLTRCIWCQLEQRGLVLFPSKSKHVQYTSGDSSLAERGPDDLLPSKSEEAAWQRISSLQNKIYTIPSITSPSNSFARRNLKDIHKDAILRRSIIRSSALAGIIPVFALGHLESIPIIVAMIVIAFLFNPDVLQVLLKGYNNELSVAFADINSAKANLSLPTVNKDLREFSINAEKAWIELSSLKGKFENEIAKELKELLSNHKDAFLSSHLIADAKIPGIGPGRSSTLASYGIETAADLSKRSLYGVSGFGPVLISALLTWTQSIINSYKAPEEKEYLRSCRKKLLSKYLPIRENTAVEFNRSIELYKQCERDVQGSLSEYTEVVTRKYDLIGSIKADKQLVENSASTAFKGKYWYLIV